MDPTNTTKPMYVLEGTGPCLGGAKRKRTISVTKLREMLGQICRVELGVSFEQGVDQKRGSEGLGCAPASKEALALAESKCNSSAHSATAQIERAVAVRTCPCLAAEGAPDPGTPAQYPYPSRCPPSIPGPSPNPSPAAPPHMAKTGPSIC